MRKIAVLMVINITIVFSFSFQVLGFSTKDGGHLTISRVGLEAVTNYHTGQLDFEEWAKLLLQGGFYERTGNLLTGAFDEDCTTVNKGAMQELPIDGEWPRGPNRWGNFFEHFFNPRTGAGLWDNRTAIARAKEYERKIKDIVCRSSSRYEQLDELSQKKINDYFGRLMHLLQDMGMSYHTRLEVHPFRADKPLEYYVEANWDLLKASDLFREEHSNTNYSLGKCIDPTVPMFRLAQWSHELPGAKTYWDCISLPSDYCELKTEMVADYATRMSARATRFTEGYIDQIWEAINSDCLCEPAPVGKNMDHADETFTVSGSVLGTTQFDLSTSDRMNLYLRLALKKDDISLLFTKQLMDIYAEAQALPPTAPQETKDEVQGRFEALFATLSGLPVRDPDEWPDVAVLENGFHEEALALINKAKEPVRLVSPDFSPYMIRSQPILVIPSGGLLGLEKSTFFKASLQEYVEKGGTLIVFGQQHGYQFSVVPVPEEQDGIRRVVDGYGWDEDQNCFADSVYLNAYHPMFAGQSRTTPSLNVDGYFTQYPSTATVLLTRTANGQPAMLTYELGVGRVIATSMYSDFAFGQSQASREEIALIRDMISWAKRPAQLPEASRGQAMNTTLDLKNASDMQASSGKISIFSPDRSLILAERTIFGDIPSQGSIQVSVEHSLPDDAPLGIYHIDYTLMDSQGQIIQPQTETDSGRFMVISPPKTGSPDRPIWFSVTTPSQEVVRGDLMNYTFHVYNNTNQARTFTIKSLFRHTRQAHTWTVNALPMQETRISGSDVYVDQYFFETMDARLYDESDREIAWYELTFRGKGEYRYEAGMITEAVTDKALYEPGETINVRVSYKSPMSSLLHATLLTTVCNGQTDPYCVGTPILKDERSVTAAPNATSDYQISFTSAPREPGYYVVKTLLYSPLGGTWPNTCSFTIPSSAVTTEPLFSGPLTTGLNQLSFGLLNEGQISIRSGSLQVFLKNSQGDILATANQLFSLAKGERKTLVVPLQVPALSFGEYTLSYIQSDETWTRPEAKIPLANTAMLSVNLDKAIYAVRETAVISATVTNAGGFNFENLQLAASIPGTGYSQVQTVNILAHQSRAVSFSALLPDSILPGLYDVSVTITLPSGSSLSQTTRFSVPESRLEITCPGSRSVRAGEAVTLMIKNAGGVDTSFSRATAELRDGKDISLLQRSFPGASLAVGEQIPLGTIQVPNQTANGGVYLRAQADDDMSGEMFNITIWLDVSGIPVTLSTRTDKEYYSDTERISGFTDVVNPASVGIEDARLDVEVYRISATGNGRFAHLLPPENWFPYFQRFSQGSMTGSIDGFMYVLVDEKIFKFDRAGKPLREWGSRGSGDGQFSRPRGMAAGPDGSIYVADSANYRIQKFDGNGNFVSKWGSSGTDDGQFDFLRGLGVDVNGFVYVLESNRIQKFDSNGNFVSKWGSYSYNCSNSGGFTDPNGIAVSSDGYIYVKDGSCGTVQKFDAEGGYVMKWGDIGSGDGQFGSDASWGNMIAIGPDGSVYVADSSYNRIQQFDANGGFVTKWGEPGTEPGDLNWPRAIAFDVSGVLHVAEDGDFSNHLHRFDAGGAHIGRWETWSSGGGRFDMPRGVAIGQDGTIYVADTNNHRIEKFDGSGAFIIQWGTYGEEDGQLGSPWDVAVGPDGSIYVADTENHRIQKFDAHGNFLAKWGTFGSGDGELSSPLGIEFGYDGSIYVVEEGNHRIQKFDAHGNFLAKWGTYGGEEGQFRYPGGVTVGPDGSIYVADTENHRIQKFDSNGTFIAQWGDFGSDEGMFLYPTGVAAGPDGSIYVSELFNQHSELNNRRVQKFDANGLFIAKWDSMTPGSARLYDPAGIAIGPDGSVAVVDGHDSRLLRLDGTGKESLFRANIAVDQPAGLSRQYTTDIGGLNGQGKSYLQATLTNSLGQTLGQSTYPFYVVKESVYVAFSTDKKMYKQGETITIRGEVRNLSAEAMNGASLTITRSGAGNRDTIYTTTLNIPANGSTPFSAMAVAETEGVFTLTCVLDHSNVTVFEAIDQYGVASPRASWAVSGPDTAGSEPFTLTVTITNEGETDITVVLTSPFDFQALAIPAGSSRARQYESQTITQDTLYTFTLSGDINRQATKMITYGLSANVTANAMPMYPEGNIAIPISVSNRGSLDGNFTIEALLQPSGIFYQKSYAVSHGRTISDTLLFNLTEGNYTLTVTSGAPPVSASSTFSVRKETNVGMAPIIISSPQEGLVAVFSEVTNYGYRTVDGAVRLSLLNASGVPAWESSQAVTLPAGQPPASLPVSLSFSPAALPPGNYTVKISLLNEGQLDIAYQTAPFAVTGAHVRLAQVPTPQTVRAGEDALFVFKAANSGYKSAPAEITLKSGNFIHLTRSELLLSGEEKEFAFAFPIPRDVEEKDYYGEYELRSEGTSIAKGLIRFHVAGINIAVSGSLDKEHYRDGETAHLNLMVSQQGGAAGQNLFVRINYGDYEEKQSFTLSGSQNIPFAVPLATITGEKLFYGIFDEGGRSIHLNSLYIHKTGDTFTITTNKQVYNQGEPLTMTMTGTATGTMTVSGPGGYSETFPFNGSATRSFTLPQVATAGTYFLEASLLTPEGQAVRAVKPIDIAGIAVKVKQAVLDKGSYLPGDTMRFSMRIESNVDLPATLKVWIVDPDKNSVPAGDRQLSLTRTEHFMFAGDYPVAITSSGIHKVIYGIYSDRLLLSSGNLSFDAGGGVILGMATDRIDYPLGSEPVTVRLDLCGTSEATVALSVDGAVAHSEAVRLNGFSTITVTIPMPGPGAHTLEAVLTAGGLSSRKETTFLYGTNLPDLSADVWGSGASIGKDGVLKLVTSAGNRGKTTAAPTTMTLYDGGAMLATFAVGELTAGAAQTFEFLWNVLGKAGEHTLVATLDPGNSLTDFIRQNNRAMRRIVIPDIALITETDKESYRTGEGIVMSATAINLTAATEYPNLTCTTVVRDVSGGEVYRYVSTLGLSPSQSAVTTATWSTGGGTSEGRYTIRQEITSGTALLAEKTKIITITSGTGFTLRSDPALLRLRQGEAGSLTIFVDAFAGWTGNITLEAEGIPAGTTATMYPDVLPGSGTSLLSIVTGSSSSPGSYPVTIRGHGVDGSSTIVQTIPITIDISGFILQAVPESTAIAQQTTAEFTVNALSMNGYEGNLVVSDSTGGIGGLVVSVANPNLSVPGGETIVRVESSKYVPPGSYPIKVSASDGITTKDVNMSVVVTENRELSVGFVLTPGPGFDNRALVTLMNRDFVEKVEFTAFNTRFGANAVMGDIDGDGEDEVIVAPGPDPLADGRIKVFRKNGVFLLEQSVLATKFGAILAAGDIDGDWREEIVVGAGPGPRNTGRLKVLSYNGQRFAETGIDFVAFPDFYRLGVKVVLGDVDGDGMLEIVAGAGPSPLSPPRVRVFKVDTTGGMGHWRIASTASDFVADFGDWYPYLFGVNVGAADVDGDGLAEIVVGAGPNPLQKAIVAVYRGDGTFAGPRFEAYPENDYRFGVNVAARDLDGDGVAEIITGLGPSPFHESWVRVFNGDGTLLSDGFLAFPESRKFGVKVSTGNVGE